MVWMTALFVLNDPPYGTGRCYNALRLAHALLKNDPAAEVTVFLMADAVIAARKGQKTPDGYYNMERMLKRIVVGKGSVPRCGTCMDARGMADGDVMDGARRSTMDELSAATVAADKVLVLRAMGAVRFSLGRGTTAAAIDEVIRGRSNLRARAA
jgi:uncharacterized protein involved in oxidation of intracellular sulfur